MEFVYCEMHFLYIVFVENFNVGRQSILEKVTAIQKKRAVANYIDCKIDFQRIAP